MRSYCKKCVDLGRVQHVVAGIEDEIINVRTSWEDCEYCNPRRDWTFNHTAYDIWTQDMFMTKEEAVEEGLKYALEMGWTSYYVGEAIRYIPYIDGDSAMDHVIDAATEELGEVAHGWLDHIKHDERDDLTNMLTETFHKWLEKTKNNQDFFTLENVEEIIIPESLTNVQ
ncbi:gp109 [Bacillus phage W.Ph.]|uniref:Gp109 n=1 Tax=Bacillus phage W.Ph. TaxID=764595 RepID=G9B1L0_9CAUD|nr:gp109 [Bacillus phage W.Ph.]ADH03255.1 gp109 [Bacillus phage W.Ph.]